VTLDARARRASDRVHDVLDEPAGSSRVRASFDRFERFRSGRERTRRVTAVALAAVVSVTAGALLVRALAPGARHVPATSPPPAGVVVFNQTVEGDTSDDIRSFTVATDGSGLSELGPSGRTYCGDNDDPWSPDGSKILCLIFRSDLTTASATVAADGSAYAEVSNPRLPASFGCSAWSPDGNHLLCPYTSDAVYTIGADGRGLDRLTTVSAGEGPSGYTADGTHAYFSVPDATQHRTLYSVAIGGTHPLVRLSPRAASVHDNPYFDGVSADSSPEGSQVVFAADVSRSLRTLFVARVDDGRAREIRTPAGVNPTSAQWSGRGLDRILRPGAAIGRLGRVRDPSERAGTSTDHPHEAGMLQPRAHLVAGRIGAPVLDAMPERVDRGLDVAPDR
jgi:dipeptidyl aminopeptidase/acylaminoacyl peptidase